MSNNVIDSNYEIVLQRFFLRFPIFLLFDHLLEHFKENSRSGMYVSSIHTIIMILHSCSLAGVLIVEYIHELNWYQSHILGILGIYGECYTSLNISYV